MQCGYPSINKTTLALGGSRNVPMDKSLTLSKTKSLRETINACREKTGFDNRPPAEPVGSRKRKRKSGAQGEVINLELRPTKEAKTSRVGSDNLEMDTKSLSPDYWEGNFIFVKKRLLQLGYHHADVDKLLTDRKMMDIVQSAVDLTDKAWQAMLPELTTAINKYTEDRLCGTIHTSVTDSHFSESHKLVLQVLYAGYKKTLYPHEWVLLPPLSAIYDIPDFLHILFDADQYHHGGLSPNSFTRGINVLSKEISRRAERIRMDLFVETKQISHRRFFPQHKPRSCISLACAVFVADSTQSLNSSPLISADSVFRYHNWDNLFSESTKSETYSLHIAASEAGAFIVSLAGLDPKYTMPGDMDALGNELQYICTRCYANASLVTNELHSPAPVFSWRGCVRHCIGTGGFCTDQFRVLGPLLRRRVQLWSSSWTPMEERKTWTCAHCTVHFHGWETFQEVSMHLDAKHGIPAPRRGVDIILRPDADYEFPERYMS